MAIRLRVQENRIRLRVGGDAIRLRAHEGVPIYPQPYTGVMEVTPSAEEQVLLTKGLMMTDHVHVNPIPSNYGLITYNGSIITVS